MPCWSKYDTETTYGSDNTLFFPTVYLIGGVYLSYFLSNKRTIGIDYFYIISQLLLPARTRQKIVENWQCARILLVKRSTLIFKNYFRRSGVASDSHTKFIYYYYYHYHYHHHHHHYAALSALIFIERYFNTHIFVQSTSLLTDARNLIVNSFYIFCAPL
jgi:hypothetical protein